LKVKHKNFFESIFTTLEYNDIKKAVFNPGVILEFSDEKTTAQGQFRI
jgi:hypothetical protein